MTTGQRIRNCRKEADISAEKLAAAIGVSPATIYRYENGDIEKVPGDVLLPISKVLRTTPAYLMGWEDSPSTDFSSILNDYKKRNGLTNEDLSKMSGVPKPTIDKITAGTTKRPSLDTVQALARACGMSLSDFDDISETSYRTIPGIEPMPRMRRIPLIGTIACGEPILAVENIEGDVEIPDSIRADFALRCKGDSMINARIFDGDMVYIREQPSVENGQIAAVLIDDEATLKRVHLFDDHIVLEPENPMYRPKVYWNGDMNAVRILGLAVAFTSSVR